jgi:hypothetical protein
MTGCASGPRTAHMTRLITNTGRMTSQAQVRELSGPGADPKFRGNHGAVGKSALLFTLAGRVHRIEGDLKVLGQVLPQAVRFTDALLPRPSGGEQYCS